VPRLKTQAEILDERGIGVVLAQKVYAMRAQGLRFWRITELLGLQDETVAHDLYSQAVKGRLAVEERRAEWARELEDERLDILIEKTRHQVMQGDVQAARVWLRVAERRAKLWGLDLAGQPSRDARPDAEIAELSDTELIRKAAQMMGLTVHDLARLSVQAVEEETQVVRRGPPVVSIAQEDDADDDARDGAIVDGDDRGEDDDADAGGPEGY
jgi:hypothetical protein